jgi:hypothetical protein
MLDGMQENYVPDLYNILQYFRFKTSFNMHNFTWIYFKKARLTFLERIANESLWAHFPLLIRPSPFSVYELKEWTFLYNMTTEWSFNIGTDERQNFYRNKNCFLDFYRTLTIIGFT